MKSGSVSGSKSTKQDGDYHWQKSADKVTADRKGIGSVKTYCQQLFFQKKWIKTI